MIKIETSQTSPCTLTVEPDGQTVAVKSPYDEKFITAIKRLPYGSARWDRTRKVWFFAPKAFAHLQEMLKKHYGQEVTIIHTTGDKSPVTTAYFTLWYLGLPREREVSGRWGMYALGHTNLELNSKLIFELKVLKQFFAGSPIAADQSLNAFQVLALQPPWEHLDDSAIKKAYHRCSKTYHPDLNKEPGAHEAFIKIKNAYDLLADPDRRKRYLFGLSCVRVDVPRRFHKSNKNDIYVPPLRCGKITVSGHQSMGQFIVSEIKEWQPLIHRGAEIVTAWDSIKQQVKWEYV